MPVFSLNDILEGDIPAIEIMDIGAMTEGQDRYHSLLEMGLASITCFEPDAAQYNKLVEDRESRTQYFPFFLGTGNRGKFHTTRYPGCSSLYEPDPAVINLFTSIGTEKEVNGNFRVLHTNDVATKCLDDIDDCPLPDFMKIDVQGSELDILKHAQNSLKNALVIECEVEFIPIYKDQPLFGDIQVYLRNYGFVLHKLIDVGGRAFRPLSRGNNPFAPISQLLWADAVFVRDFTDLELFGDNDLLKAALILHQVYYSYDLVMHLLREYDRRHGSDFTNKYLQAFSNEKDIPFLYMNHKDYA